MSEKLLNRLHISIRNFDNTSEEDVEFFQTILSAIECGNFLNTICPVDEEDDCEPLWGVSSDIDDADTELYSYDEDDGLIDVDYDSYGDKAVPAFVNAVLRGGLWSRLVFKNMSMFSPYCNVSIDLVSSTSTHETNVEIPDILDEEFWDNVEECVSEFVSYALIPAIFTEPEENADGIIRRR